MAEEPNLSQRAGNHSQLNQAGRDSISGEATVINATTANIYLTDTRPGVVAREYSADAAAVATKRLTAFDEAIVERLDILERLNALADPGYQKTLSGARVAAAGSDRPADAERLVELMAERAADPDRLLRATVSRAIQIIDDVDEDCLLALVWYHAGSTHIQGSMFVSPFLEQWERKLETIGFAGQAPPPGWLQHLHVVGAVRLDSSGAHTLKSITDWMTQTQLPFFMPGISEAGLLERSATYAAFGVRLLPYVQHELRPGYYRLLAKERPELDRLLRNMNPGFTSNSAPAIEQLIEDFQPILHDATAIDNFRGEVIKHERLADYDAWRLSLANPVYITHVGIALVWAQLKQRRIDVEPLTNMLSVGD